MIQPIDLAEMQQDLAKAFVLTSERYGAPHETIARECARAGVDVNDVLSTKRDRVTAHLRQDIMRMIRDTTDLSLPQIGRLFGRDHTTVLHGITASEARKKGSA